MSGSVTPVVAVLKKTPDDLTGWRSKTTTLLSRATFLVNTPEMSDVKFIFKTKDGTQETIIYGHKFILAMASPVFHKMFFNQNPDLLTPVEDKVEMKDHPFSAEAFLPFVKFLYTDKIDFEADWGLTVEVIFGILNCADYYDVPFLKTDCVQQLVKIMTTRNVLQILETAWLFREYGLARSAIVFINGNPQVLESEDFLSLKKETLFVIFNRDRLDLDECFVLDLALKWAEHECKRKSLESTAKNKREVLGAVFLEIRFALLTSDRISELVASNFLTLEESLDISLAVHNPGYFTRTSTTPDGSKFRRSAPGITFKSKPRVFGQRMELTESKKMEAKWKEDNKLDYWKSLAKVEADLYMEGFPKRKNEFELTDEIQQAGFHTVLFVNKLRDNRNRGTFHVKFLYNPSVYEFSVLLNPNTFGFFDAESIEIREWVII